MTSYVRGGATFNGDGTTPAAATVGGGVGAYNVPPTNTFATGDWELVAGTVLDMGATALTTGNSANIGKYGTGPDPIITGTNSTLLSSATASGVTLSNIVLLRSGAVGGIGYNAQQTTGTTINGCTFTGFGDNLSVNDAVGLTVNGCTFNGAVTSYGIRATQATVACTGWRITDNTFNTAISIDMQASSSTNQAGSYTSPVITGNTFNASVSSAIIMQSVMNLTRAANTLQVLSGNRIVMTNHTGGTNDGSAGTWPAWASQTLFLAGFSNAANFGAVTVGASPFSTTTVANDTLTVAGITLSVEDAGTDKGVFLVDPTRAFNNVEIAENSFSGHAETPLLLAGLNGGRIHHNTVRDCVQSGSFAAGIELAGCYNGLVVHDNVVDNLRGLQAYDIAGIFVDGGCSKVVVRQNTVSNIPGGADDNSGQGIGIFYATNCTVEANHVENCNRGVWFGGTTTGTAHLVRNNTFADNRIGLRVNVSPAAGSLSYSNNMFVRNDVAIDDAADMGTATNWYWENGARSAGTYDDPSPLTSDPLLDARYRLRTGSPAIAGGTPNSAKADRDGAQFWSTPSVGAYEHLRARSTASARTTISTARAART